MRSTRSLLGLLLLGAFGLSCRTLPIPRLNDPAPPGIRPWQVELAILSAVAGRSGPPHAIRACDAPSQLTDDELRAWLGTPYPDGWVYESHWKTERRKPGAVIVGMNRRRTYLELRIDFDARGARPHVALSERLRQGHGRIHKQAVAWIDALNQRIVWNLRQLRPIPGCRPGRPAPGRVLPPAAQPHRSGPG